MDSPIDILAYELQQFFFKSLGDYSRDQLAEVLKMILTEQNLTLQQKKEDIPS